MEIVAFLLLTTILSLLAFALIPSTFANCHQRAVRQYVTAISGAQFLIAGILAAIYLAGQGKPLEVALIPPGGTADGIGIYYDGATSLMLVMVSFVGFIVSRFSIRYLDGESSQGRYFRWLAFTLGAVSSLVVAGNLLMFMGAWVMTSLGLHQLLIHYRHRPAARRAAWTKFAISRLGDGFLTVAIVLIAKTFGTLEFSTLFQMAKELPASELTSSHTAIGWLLMLGAVTKSAQFPFHTWLPDTMETPTPVSALMHAGIVNAGGYLVIRMSPLVVLAPSAMMTLATIGAFTACFAGIVMMTQPSIKRSLAYSTIAQMGFMMLQCGIGALSAAMLHILAHSLYKAHAFLGSGSVVAQSQAIRGATITLPSPRTSIACVIAAALTTVIGYYSITQAFGLDLFAKSGGLVLAFILCLALTTWGWRLLSRGQQVTALAGVAGVVSLIIIYVASYLAVDVVVAGDLPSFRNSSAAQVVLIGVGLAFCLLFALHMLVYGRRRSEWLEPLWIHAANGFYVDALYRRVFASLVRS
jgi:NAD(P)H-quinone oxidoreductase subunit 5